MTDPSEAAGIDEEALLRDLDRDESLRLFPYDSATGRPIGPGSRLIGTVTIGVGRDLNTHGISLAEARAMEAGDIDEVCASLNQIAWFAGLDALRKRVLVEMAFNMGVGGVLKFQAMVAALKAQDYEQAAVEMLNSRWATQVGPRAMRLAEMMRDGHNSNS